MLNIVLAEAEVELVPKEISRHPTILASALKSAQNPTEMILQSTHHHKAMYALDDAQKRGRPDILHFSLLNALHSPLNNSDKLNIHIHTRHDEMISISRYTRIPKDYNRFLGLIRQLLVQRKVPPQQPLLEVTDMTLTEFLEKQKPSKVYTLSRHGKEMSPINLGKKIKKEKNPFVLIGCFPHGGFSTIVEKLTDETISIYKNSLPAWVVVSEVISGYEHATNLFTK